MKKDLEIWQFICERLVQKRSVTLLVVAESSGSSPGRQGFKMAVAGDELCGSIGGGVMEVSLVSQAKVKSKKAKGKSESKVQSPKSKVVEQVHRKDSPNSSGMICSGEQTVIFFELDFEHLKPVREIISALENHQSKTLKISDSRFQISDDVIDEFDFRFEQKSENEFLFEEKLGFKNKLFIIGGGHCALALSELMSKMDFYISLFDDRPNLNTLAKNEFVHEKNVIKTYEEIGEYISSGENVYVVVMTLGYKFDETVIRKLFDKDFKYFGVLGSKAKMAVLLRELLKEGFDKKRLDKIHTPIGLDINSRTPEEIAVSIAAEIIAVKNGIEINV
jgi:xanthine dehydrogenase accessory factor